MSDTQRYDLKHCHGDEFTITIKPGMGWAIYTDSGPSGPCGQSMSVTCPHAIFALYPDEETMRASVESRFRQGKMANLIYGVVGEWATGNGAIVVVDGEGGST